MSSTTVQWRVQVKAKTGRWINKGLYEVRSMARFAAVAYRQDYGFGNTRVQRYEKVRK